MSRFNTGNPLGSNDPRDLDDNAKNMDLAVNSDAPQWVDRLARNRKTFAGMESEFQSAQDSRETRFNDFIASSGYQFAGDYGPGIEITEYNQLVRDEDGEFWRVSGQVDLPYVTTGAGIPEGDALVPAGDAVLRQDLANPDKGAALVARGVVAVDSIADLLALPEGQRKEGLRYLVKEYHTGTNIGGGEFYWDAASTEPTNGGTILSSNPTSPGRWMRNAFGVYHVDWFGTKINDPTYGVENYNAIRKCHEVAINEIGRRGIDIDTGNGKSKIVLGTGIYYIKGHSVFAFSNEELFDFGYYGQRSRRSGIHWEGSGKNATVVELQNYGEESWLFDVRNPSDGKAGGVYDYVTFSNMTLRGEGYNTRKYRVPVEQKVNGFYMESYGMEKYLTFENMVIRGFDKAFSFTGYGNADHNSWIGCHIGAIRDYCFYFNNAEAVANRIIATDLESIYGDTFLLGPDGGGDITYIGGSVILHALHGENNLPDPAASSAERRAFFRVKNDMPIDTGNVSPANATYLFKKLRFEIYDDYQAIVYANLTGQGSASGNFLAEFEQCFFAIQNTRSEIDGGLIVPPHSSKRIDTLLHGHRGRVVYRGCSHGPRGLHQIKEVIEPLSNAVIAFEYPYLAWSDSAHGGLKDKCSIQRAAGGVSNGAIYAKNVNALRVVNQNGSQNRRNAFDFEISAGRHYGAGSVMTAQMKNYERDWAEFTPTEDRVYLPPESLVTGFTIYKPGTSVGGGTADYFLRIGTPGNNSVWNSGTGDEERMISKHIVLDEPIMTSSDPAASYFYVTSGGGSLATLGIGGQVVVHYM